MVENLLKPNKIIVFLITGLLIVFLNFFVSNVVAPVLFGISVFIFNFSIDNSINKSIIIKDSLWNFAKASIYIFVFVILITLISCQFIASVNLYCSKQNFQILIIKEFLVFYIPYVFVLAFWLRKVLMSWFNKRNK